MKRLSVFLLVLGVLAQAQFASATPIQEEGKKDDKAVAKESAKADDKEEEAKEKKDTRPSLTIGDAAPPISIVEWIKGKPVKGFDKGKVYVVEFWATWCGPCLRNMPHMSELAEKHGKKVQFIGISDEEVELVADFMEKDGPGGEIWDDVIKYTIAMDDDHKTTRAYMLAAKQMGIPCAFIVGKDAKVEWIGHPATIDKPLDGVLAGDWDRKEALANFKKVQAKQAEEMKRMVAARKAQAAMQADMQDAGPKLQAAVQEEDWDAAIKVLDPMIKKYPNQAMFSRTKMNILKQANRVKELCAFCAEITKGQWDQPQALNEVAWTIAGELKGKDRDLDLAMKAAKRANELSNSKNAPILDTVARCYFEMGDIKSAIKWQNKAIDNLNDEPAEMQDQIEDTLIEYENALKKKSNKKESEKKEEKKDDDK